MSATDELTQAAIDFTRARDAAELNLTGAILAYPTRGIRAANAAGFSLANVARVDLQIILAAVCVKTQLRRLTWNQDQDRVRVYRLARLELQNQNLWEADLPACFYGSDRWSDATLAVLFDAFFHSDQLITRYVATVADFAQRWADANAFYRASIDRLTVSAKASKQINNKVAA